MSDTPETDKAERMAFAGEYMVPTELARQLERERDEARAWAETLQRNACQHSIRAENAERERDEAREVLREIAEASHFDNISNWARNKAKEALK